MQQYTNMTTICYHAWSHAYQHTAQHAHQLYTCLHSPEHLYTHTRTRTYDTDILRTHKHKWNEDKPLWFYPMISHSNRCVKCSPAHSYDFKVDFRSELCGSQSMCENDVSCFLNHSFTIWVQSILALPFWNMPTPLGKKKMYCWKNLVSWYISGISWPHLLQNLDLTNWSKPW